MGDARDRPAHGGYPGDVVQRAFDRWIDPAAGEETPTQLLQEQSPHSCAACPVEVRDLYATLHNLLIELARDGALMGPRLQRKATAARLSVERFRPLINAHFDALGQRR